MRSDRSHAGLPGTGGSEYNIARYITHDAIERKSPIRGGRPMCLAVPVRVIELRGADRAVVDLGGTQKEVSLALLDGVSVGDYVILHVGFALARLDPEEAAKTLALFAQLDPPSADP